MTKIKERWKIIQSYSNYAVSSKGRVRNLNTGRILKHQKSESGGWYSFIQLSQDGERKNYNVHVLVAKAFMGPTPAGHVIHHIDHNRNNPVLENLNFETFKINRILRKK